jgi:mannose-6-phosphate isomerase-like protein (cupin superfamily)
MLIRTILLAFGLATALCSPLKSTHDKRDTEDLNTQLVLAPTDAARTLILAQLGGNESFVFDFGHPPNGSVAKGAGGQIVQAVSATFPALVGRKSGAFVFTINPCGMVPPHFHPRSDEFFVVTEGTIFAQFLTETGSVLITNNITTFQGQLLPAGAIHLQWNPTCGPATFVSGFNDNDPGASFLAPGLLGFETDLVDATFGGDMVISGADLESIKEALPAGAVISVGDCLTRCGIKPNAKRSVSEIFGRK